VTATEHKIEVVSDATGAFSELADKGLWDTKTMRLVALPSTPDRPYATAGVLCVLPRNQAVYVESRLDMLYRAVRDLYLYYSVKDGLRQYIVTFDVIHVHGEITVTGGVRLDVEATSAQNAVSVATTILRTFFLGHVVNVEAAVRPRKG